MTAARCALAVCAVALVLPASALAHPQAASSRPSADAVLEVSPGVVSVTFSEDVEPVGDALEVIGPSGDVATRGGLERRGRTFTRRVVADARGSYLVRWQVVGDDTHPARGAFLFSVGERTRAGVPGSGSLGVTLQSAARWLAVAGFALGFAVPFVTLLALRAETARRSWRLVQVGIGLMVLAEPVGLAGQTTTLAPTDPFDLDLAADVLRTSYGHTAALRLGLALGLWALVAAARESGRRGLIAISTVGALGCVVQAMSLHRVEDVPAAVGLALGAVHVAGAAVWLGALALVLAGTSVASVTPIAGSALLVAIVTGGGLSLAHLTAIGDLVRSSYGIVVVVKVLVVLAALATGALARRRRRVRVVEGLLAAVVVALGALLATLAPPL